MTLILYVLLLDGGLRPCKELESEVGATTALSFVSFPFLLFASLKSQIIILEDRFCVLSFSVPDLLS
ncbi:hypothetical protein IMY05_017G0025300 [Salix suchowensis]|nr:hypothetical protein IMY05_017G0025300 [Salix suchowensis]